MSRKFDISDLWVRRFLSSNENEPLSKRVSSVDNISYYSFNAEYAGSFFAETRMLLSSLKITSPSQIFNFDETGFILEKDRGVKNKI